ncbi:uncharacterized protein I206_104571 [Kwoniella pini CBS 10737]|uniref:Uncharacterized protein n=1 Tax=Kwoniella pini CBS 10737 TaxID=1296096 RepID=A0A1B9I784_9TREE|nr:uncharacterized protein I206_02106 [Kwoniella pini CBS 10737]OCF51392.1 hypothetical protein I206_02106 [Kwoniella pini CBS 10737]
MTNANFSERTAESADSITMSERPDNTNNLESVRSAGSGIERAVRVTQRFLRRTGTETRDDACMFASWWERQREATTAPESGQASSSNANPSGGTRF